MFEVKKSGEILICPIELSAHSLREGEHQHVVVNDHYLSLRKSRACQYPSGQPRADMLFVHTRQGTYTTRHTPDLLPGQSKEFDGFTINYLGYGDETARLEITI